MQIIIIVPGFEALCDYKYMYICEVVDNSIEWICKYLDILQNIRMQMLISRSKYNHIIACYPSLLRSASEV